MLKDEIIMGAGEVFMYEFEGASVPEHTVIETDAHNVGHCSGGFSIEYKPEKYDIINQYGKIVKSFITKEEITAKTGILSWDLERLAMLSAAKLTFDNAKKIRKLTFGAGGNLKSVLIRFVHTKDNGKKIRFTMIGQGGNGFALEYSGEKELVVDAELTAIEYVKGFLAEFEEELTEEEAQELNSSM